MINFYAFDALSRRENVASYLKDKRTCSTFTPLSALRSLRIKRMQRRVSLPRYSALKYGLWISSQTPARRSCRSNKRLTKRHFFDSVCCLYIAPRTAERWIKRPSTRCSFLQRWPVIGQRKNQTIPLPMFAGKESKDTRHCIGSPS